MRDAYTTLICVDDLAAILDAASGDTPVILDCRFDLLDPKAGRAAWLQSHLPGAQFVDLDRDLAGAVSPVAGGRHPLPEPQQLAASFGKLGVGEGTQVVVYDDVQGMFAARTWWLLRWLGHDRVALLDGGWQAWQQAGLPVTDQIITPRPAKFPSLAQTLPVLTAAEVGERLAADDLLLLDVRAAERFLGRSEPIDPVAGHVPGAVNVPLSGNLAPDGRFLAPADLAEIYRKVIGARPMSSVVCMCGSGVSACHTLLALEVAGLPGAGLYAGSWSDWISDPARPVAAD